MIKLLEIKNLSKSYYKREVIRDISFKVKKEEFVTILGRSGCGKTTLLKIIAGLIDFTAGEVKIKEENKIGFVFQEPNLLPWFSSFENIALPLEIKKYSKEEINERVNWAISLVGLQSFKDYLPEHLSGGMKQRVSLARALVTDSDLLLMDEPFGLLDEITREELNLELTNIWLKCKKTIVFITHSIHEAINLSEKVIILSGNPTRIFSVIDISLLFPRDPFDPLYLEKEIEIKKLFFLQD